jgi:DNA-binding response OmpR family regulator
LLTAKGEISDKLLALDTGADDYLVKPCDQGELMARVRAGLRIVLLTQDMRHAVGELAVLRAEVQRVRDTLQVRGIEWPEGDANGKVRRSA